MKTLILITALMLLSINLYSAPPDSCLWAPDLTNVKENTAVLMLNFLKVDPFNRDSTLYVDTCGLEPSFYRDKDGNLIPDGGSQYRFEKRYYSKSVWDISISRSIFDTIGKDLNAIRYFTVDDIDTNESDIYNSFQLIKQEYGNIKFWFSLDKELSIQEAWLFKDEYSYIETENLVNSLEFEDYVNELLPNSSCQFLSEISYTVSVDDTNTNFIIRVSQDFNSLKIESDELIKNTIVFSLEGVKLFELMNNNNQNTDLQINISHLPTGVYFIQVNNSMRKFMLVR